jgi:uncharacterized protein
MGSSYLGYTQWALLADPPPELATAIISVGPHDLSAAAWATGAFALNDFLGWSDLVARQEDGRVKPFVVGLLGHWRVNPAMRALPLGEAGRRLLRDGAPWYEDGSDTRIRRTSTGVRCDRPPRWIGFRSRCC